MDHFGRWQECLGTPTWFDPVVQPDTDEEDMSVQPVQLDADEEDISARMSQSSMNESPPPAEEGPVAQRLRSWLQSLAGNDEATYSDLFCPFLHEVFSTDLAVDERAAWLEIFGGEWQQLVSDYHAVLRNHATAPATAHFSATEQIRLPAIHNFRAPVHSVTYPPGGGLLAVLWPQGWVYWPNNGHCSLYLV